MPIRPENRDRYPDEWPEISAMIRFGRAAGQCECLGECGRGTHAGRCPNVHGGEAYGTGSEVMLTTAHLDHTPENCDPANLRAFCQGCHLHYDHEHHQQTRAANRRAALEAAGQLALELGEFTLDPDADPDAEPSDDELDEWLDAAAAEYWGNGGEPEVLAGYGRPATRAPTEEDRGRVINEITELPPIDKYNPTEGTAA